jgi:hypothetical protein
MRSRCQLRTRRKGRAFFKRYRAGLKRAHELLRVKLGLMKLGKAHGLAFAMHPTDFSRLLPRNGSDPVDWIIPNYRGKPVIVSDAVPAGTLLVSP